MEQYKVANDLISLKKLLAHKRGGSVYVSEDVIKQIAKLDGKTRMRLKEELEFRFIKIKKYKIL